MSSLVKLKPLKQNRGWEETAKLAYRCSPAVSSSCKKFNVIGILISFPLSFLQNTKKIHKHDKDIDLLFD